MVLISRNEIISNLLDQAEDRESINGGEFAYDARVLREAVQLLNMDADLRDQYECAIRANEELRAKKVNSYPGSMPDKQEEAKQG